jgi:hypothetical protein
VTAAETTEPGPLCNDADPLAGPDADDAGMTAARRARPGGLCYWLQAFEDAAKWRHARASAPCNDCDVAAPDMCDDHGRDVGLISEYRRTAAQLMEDEAHPLSADTRVTAARELLAEHHQPAAMPPGDLRALLARYQKQLHGLLDAVSGGDPETGP